VSTTTAVAVRRDQDRVGVYLTGAELRVRVNGAPVELPVALPGGGRVRGAGPQDGFISPAIVFEDQRDGPVISVENIGGMLDVSVALPESMRGRVTGLLGNFDGNPDDDLRPRDGKPYGEEPTEKELYGRFNESWRVAPDASLFDYEPGKSTDSYTRRGFPLDVRHRATAAVLAIANAACRGLGLVGASRDACVLDVSMTGNPAVALSSVALARDMQRAAGARLSAAPPVAAPEPADTGVSDPDDLAHPIDVKALSHADQGTTITLTMKAYEDWPDAHDYVLRWELNLDSDPNDVAEVCLVVREHGGGPPFESVNFWNNCNSDDIIGSGTATKSGAVVTVKFDRSVLDKASSPLGSAKSYQYLFGATDLSIEPNVVDYVPDRVADQRPEPITQTLR
jgi:hypothetical protein